MHIVIRTPVAGYYESVLDRFDRELFEELSPPGAKVDLVRFDGSKTGDIVHIRLSLGGLFPQDWISEITDHGVDENQAWFVDEGRELPFFLTAWKHRHVVEKEGDHSVIVDDIRFQTPWFIPAVVMKPILKAQFGARGPIYQRVFGRPI